jgi:hypothetical protein
VNARRQATYVKKEGEVGMEDDFVAHLVQAPQEVLLPGTSGTLQEHKVRLRTSQASASSSPLCVARGAGQ